jgi:hypothetical protein
MNLLPGFTAEASLYKESAGYQAAAAATIHGGLVQPASPFAEETILDKSLTFLGPVFTPRPAWCFRQRCKNVAPPGHKPLLLCSTVLGFWNPVTQRCE